MDLTLAVATGLHRAGGAKAIAHVRQRLWPEPSADIYRGNAGRGYRRTRGEDEMGIAIAIVGGGFTGFLDSSQLAEVFNRELEQATGTG